MLISLSQFNNYIKKCLTLTEKTENYFNNATIVTISYYFLEKR
jgi:hypothetical protein